MRRVGVVTVGRSDWGILRPVVKRIVTEPELDLMLIAAGMHLDQRWGKTVDGIEAEGCEVAHRVACPPRDDSPGGVAEAMGAGIQGFAAVFAAERPDILLVMGDRFEMFAAAVAALPFKIPVAHIHGGELTQGALDDALRHSITKLAHVHFVATDEYAGRVIQMGEEPQRVTVTGAPGLDNIREMELLTTAELQDKLGVRWDMAPLLVTFHPVTLEYEATEYHISELLTALENRAEPLVFTAPNADTGNLVIRRKVVEFAGARDGGNRLFIENLGTRDYFSLMACAAAMVGNSSSGIIEAPSFALPVVNIGTRQQGRMRAANVIDVGYGRDEIAATLERAVSPEFRASLRGMENPYGDGRAAQRIVERLKSVELGQSLVMKRFYDHSSKRVSE